MVLFFNLVAANCLIFDDQGEPKSPNWVQLCDEGHQYLFSEELLDWNNAKEMCELLGGYLVRIENRHENNCILVHAQNTGQHSWWWTSGNDVDIEGYFVMEDGKEMNWISFWYWYGKPRGSSYDAIVIGTTNDEYAGIWSDQQLTDKFQYICEKEFNRP